MTSQILAPIHVDSLYLVDCSMHLEPEPAAEMDLSFDIKFEQSSLDRDENDSARKDLILHVSAGMSSVDDSLDSRFSAEAAIQISVSVDASDVEDDEKIDTYLSRNALSIAYSHARSAIMTMTGLSPMGTFMIPAILPDELLKQRGEES